MSGVRWRLSALLVAVVLAVGLLGSWALAAAVDEQEQALATIAMDQRVDVIESAVAAEVRRYTETSSDLAAAIGAQSDLSATDFSALTSNISRSRLPGISGVSLVIPATTKAIPQTQREWRDRGNRQLVLEASGTGDDHRFVVLTHAPGGSRAETGQDVSASPVPTQAMDDARDRNEVTASASYVVSDRGLPRSQRQQSFVLAAPIVGGTGTPAEGRFLGWLLFDMQGRDLIGQTIDRASQSTVAVRVMDSSTPAATSLPVAEVGQNSVVDGTKLEQQVAIPVAGRTWQLQVRPTTRFMASLGPSLSTPAGGAGVVFTLLLAALVGTLSTSRNQALAKVDRATSALRADIERRERVEATLREREEELRVMALTDPLTGLANRRAFMSELDQAHARGVRSNSPVCVLFCDVDHFKEINDTYGHAAGDSVLREVARRLRENFRAGDTVGRVGGDEFAVICQDGSGPTEFLLERLTETLSVPHAVEGQLVMVTVSVGMASPADGESGMQLLERADSAMYSAKSTRHAK